MTEKIRRPLKIRDLRMDGIPNRGGEKQGHLGEGKAEAKGGIEEGNN